MIDSFRAFYAVRTVMLRKETANCEQQIDGQGCMNTDLLDTRRGRLLT